MQKPLNEHKFELVDASDKPVILSSWKKEFLWKPVFFDQEWHWLETVYKRIEAIEIESEQGHVIVKGWRYGTIMDILKNGT